jgi:NADPH:quinone reductase-like Zn-dependent oxidoreductase
VVARLGEDALPLLAAGRIVVPVQETFPLDQAQAAYAVFAAGGKFGKLVLVV